MAHHGRHGKLGPPRRETTEFTSRHIALWPTKFSITSKHVTELVRLAQSSSPMPPSGADEMHILFHLLVALSPEAASIHTGDVDALAQHLHGRVTTAREGYALLVQMRDAPLDVLEGRLQPMDAKRVDWVKEQIAARNGMRGLNVDTLTLGSPERRMPAITLLILLRTLQKVRPGFDVVEWDATDDGAVDHDMLLAELTETYDGQALMHKVEAWGFDTRAQGRAALEVLICAIRAGNLSALKFLCLRYPHLHNALVQEETGMTPLHHLAEAAGSKVSREDADAIIGMLFPFAKAQALDVGITPSPRSDWGSDPTHAVGTTPLMLAISNLSLGVAAALLGGGASVSATNRLGLTALALGIISKDRATKDPSLEKYRSACQLLLDGGAQVPAKGALSSYKDASTDLLAFCKGYKAKKPANITTARKGGMKTVVPTSGDGGGDGGITWGQEGGEDADLESAARDIQRIVRGGIDRKKFKQSQGLPSPRPAEPPSSPLQRMSPKHGGSKSPLQQQQSSEEEEAARQIQRIIRGGVARKKVEKVKGEGGGDEQGLQQVQPPSSPSRQGEGAPREKTPPLPTNNRMSGIYVYGVEAMEAAKDLQRVIRGGVARKKVAKAKAAAGGGGEQEGASSGGETGEAGGTTEKPMGGGMSPTARGASSERHGHQESAGPSVVHVSSAPVERMYESEYHEAATNIQKIVRGGVTRRKANNNTSSSDASKSPSSSSYPGSSSIVNHGSVSRHGTNNADEAADGGQVVIPSSDYAGLAFYNQYSQQEHNAAVSIQKVCRGGAARIKTKARV